MDANINPIRKRTLYDKIWDDHVIYTGEQDLSLLYIDRHLVHEVTSPQAFDGLKARGRLVRRPDCTLATVDHNIPTLSRKEFTSVDSYVSDPRSREQCKILEENAKTFQLKYFGMKDRRQGIVHVIGPEQGFTLPGITCVCGDSHSSTHGAFGSLAFGIGTSEVEHVLATQTLMQKKSKAMCIRIDGNLNDGVTSKDVILHIIGVIGTAGATGCVIEYAGSVIRNFSMEARMTICNMSIEAGARAGMVAPDDVTFSYLQGRPLAPSGHQWAVAVDYWRTLRSDAGAHFDINISIDAAEIVPTVTWGTSPQDVVPITGSVPDPSLIDDQGKRSSMLRALQYMGLEPNTAMEEIELDKVFIGSCTNSRIEDLRAAAKVIIAAGPGAVIAPRIQALVVPGSGVVKQHAEAEGLDVIFTRAEFEWREAGCSMCVGMNADMLGPGERCASTSNRNFQGRQGAGGRTHLMSPAMAAAAALTGKITDVRRITGKPISQHQVGEVKHIRDLGLLDSAVEGPDSTHLPESRAIDNFDNSTIPRVEMKKFTVLKGIAAPIHIENIDTDLIIPVDFCKTLRRTGLAEGLFHALRQNPATGERSDFILNISPYDKACILVCTGTNFGCGSSREHASWSLKDFGILCVIAPSFGEIFRNNAMQNGILPISVPQDQCRLLAEDAEAGFEFEVDLEHEEIRRINGLPSIYFTTDPFRRHFLLNGLDDISHTMQKELLIAEFEKRRTQTWPWLDGVGLPGKIVPVPPTKSSKQMDW